VTEFIVRNLEDEIWNKLRDRAQAHGCSMEEEVRDILRGAVISTPEAPRQGLGSQIAELFRDQPDFGDEPFVVEELRGGVPKPMSFDE
jgi:plasmid stability protein